MPHKDPRLNAAEIARILPHHGFLLVSQRGSHQKWRNQTTGKQVIVPMHKGKELPFGTMMSIIDGSGIPVNEFQKQG
jgi:predicted RNA binding protein YcfA (HicA-like mRNA interferase family)